MNNFNFQNELQKLVESKKLIAVRFRSVPEEFKVAYILNANSEFTTIAEITDTGGLDGVSIYPSDEISSLGFKTEYLDELETKVDPSTLNRALANTATVKDFSFKGFAAAFANTDTLVEVEYETDFRPFGKITGYDDEGLYLEECDDEFDTSLASFLIKFPAVQCMSLDIPYMREE